MPVVLDTNAALLPFSHGCDLEQLWELTGTRQIVLPSSVEQELRTHAEGKGELARHAQAALRLLATAARETTQHPGDDGVLDVARRLQAIVVTQDKTLQQEARRSGLRCIAARRNGRFHWL